jgi:hypothetical protein
MLSARSCCHHWPLFTVGNFMPEKLQAIAISSRSSFMYYKLLPSEEEQDILFSICYVTLICFIQRS